jgi:hypothetical protein
MKCWMRVGNDTVLWKGKEFQGYKGKKENHSVRSGFLCCYIKKAPNNGNPEGADLRI